MSAAAAPAPAAPAPAPAASPAPAPGTSLLSPVDGGTPAGAAPAPTSLTVVANAQQAEATRQWVEQITDPALKAYATNKGWATPGDIAETVLNLEKLLGGEKIPTPKGPEDKEGWDRFYKAAGRPETPEGYKLPAPIDGDQGFLADAAKIFHANGLSTNQATALTKWYGEFGQKIQSAQAAATATRNAQELEAFKTEQGALFDAKLELGRRAAKQFGFTNDELVAMEQAFGTKTLLTRFAAIGQGMAEHSVTGEAKPDFGLSATGAAAAITALKTDKEFQAKYLSGDMAAKNRMTQLQAAAAGMTAEQYAESLGTPSRDNTRTRR